MKNMISIAAILELAEIVFSVPKFLGRLSDNS